MKIAKATVVVMKAVEVRAGRSVGGRSAEPVHQVNILLFGWRGGDSESEV